MNDKAVAVYNLTRPQQSIYNSILFYNKSYIFNISASLTFAKKINPKILETALNNLIEMNDALRIRVFKTHQGTRQYIAPYVYESIGRLNFKDRSVAEICQELACLTENELFGYHKQLYDFSIIDYGNNYGCYMKVSHLAVDGWSLVMLGMQLEENCRRLLASAEIYPRPSYIGFIKREKEYLSSIRYQNDHTYWEKTLKAGARITHLKPILGIYSKDTTLKACREKELITKEMTREITEFCKENGLSVFSLFTAVIAIYLGRMSQSEDIIIGTPILNRSHEERNTVGMFVSLLPLRVEVSFQSSFIENTRSISRRIMNTMRHSHFPTEDTLELFRRQNNISQLPYDVVVSFQNASFSKSPDTLDYEADWHFNGYEPNTLLISIGDRSAEGHLVIEADYRKNILDQNRIKSILSNIRVIMAEGIHKPQKKCSELNILTQEEKHELLFDFNHSNSNLCPVEKTLQQLFEDQTARTPSDTFVMSDGREVTYVNINRKANQLARVLQKHGVRADVPVAIMVERSVEMIIGIIAIMKAGGCYLPIDPGYPVRRLAYILKDCNVKIFLTLNRNLPTEVKMRTICIDLDNEDTYRGASDNLPWENTPEDLAYIMYTSGSTGKPKGVAVPHKSLVTRLLCMKRDYNIQREDVFIQKTSPMFDVSITEIFLPALSGCRLIVPPPGIEREIDRLLKYFNDYGVTIVNFVPSMLSVFLEYVKVKNERIPSLRYLFCAGESLTIDQVKKAKRILGKSISIANQYGPTETSYSSAYVDIQEDESVLIGKPMDYTTFYILDEYLNLVPKGIRGEIYIGGSGVARGYVSNTSLTKERFLKSPFSENERLYRSGDYGRWTDDGNIEFLGREDNQVKVRGFRVELGEIEKVLEENPSIHQAVVMLFGEQLAAYICTKETIDVDFLKKSLIERLPLYMVPSQYHFIERMPLTRNGKIDKQKLITLKTCEDVSRITFEYMTDDEVILKSLWETVLMVKPASVEDDFFEMGGDSLKAVSLALEIEKAFNIEFPVGEIYVSRTIKQQAHIVKYQQTKVIEGSVLLRRGNEQEKTIFFVHGGSGSIGGYVNMFHDTKIYLDERFTVYGIRYDRMNTCGPIEEKIENLAIDYLNRIKRVQSYGAYNLAAWCIGAQIITEIAFLMETEGFEIGKLIFFNSIAPREWEKVEAISLEEEKNFGSRLIGDVKYKRLEKCRSVEEVWDLVSTYSKKYPDEVLSRIPNEWLNSIPNFRTLEIHEVLYYLNCMRSLVVARATYKPKGKVKAQCIFINPKEDKTIPTHLKADNIRAWNKYFEKPIIVLDVMGDEHSIFDEDVSDTIRALNSVLI